MADLMFLKTGNYISNVVVLTEIPLWNQMFDIDSIICAFELHLLMCGTIVIYRLQNISFFFYFFYLTESKHFFLECKVPLNL